MKRMGVSTFAMVVAAPGDAVAEQYAGDQRTFSGIITTEYRQIR